jgi:hypothetical protein
VRRPHALLLAAVVSAWVALLDERVAAQVAVAAPACAELDVRAIERALEVEIDDVAAAFRDLAAPIVLLGCADDRVRIEITDPVTDKSVARTVPMPPADRERVLALAIAQLFLTSWLELLLEGNDADGPGAEAAEARARGAVAASVAPPAVVIAPPASPPDASPPADDVIEETPAPLAAALAGEVSLEAGPRFRFDGENVVSACVAARGVLVLEELVFVGLRVEFDAARVQRTRGAIDAYVGSTSLLAGVRTPPAGPFFLDASVGVGPVLLVLEGRPFEPDVAPGSTRALAAQAFLELAPSLRMGPVIIALPLTLSGMAFAPEGRVTGEAPVVIGGPAMSAGLRVALDSSRF